MTNSSLPQVGRPPQPLLLVPPPPPLLSLQVVALVREIATRLLQDSAKQKRECTCFSAVWVLQNDMFRRFRLVKAWV